MTTVRTGKPSMTMQWREIHHNFFIDNYSPQENVDNDDGSAYYHTHHNFFVYGSNGMKNDFGGHDNYHHDNVYGYCGEAIGFYDAPMLEGHLDSFVNNKVVMTGTDVGKITCSKSGQPANPVMGNNSYFTKGGKVTKCGKPLDEPGSTANELPADDIIFGWVKALLSF